MKINLISGPRNVSTALMYSFAQRPDMEVIDEPFYARYLHITGIDHPGRAAIMNAQQTEAENIITHINNVAGRAQHLFIKNMAHHLAYIPNDFISDCHNIFLIRDPREMLLSFIKNIPNPTLQDTAYKHQYRLFEYTRKKLSQPPIVIDAKELLKNPAAVLEKGCRKLSIPFDKRMLTWEKGPIPADGVWARHWYQNVHKSTGFKPYSAKEGAVPDRLRPLLQKCQRYYTKLYAHAIEAEG